MYTFQETTNFRKQFRKLTRRNPVLKKQVLVTLKKMAVDPLSRSLNSHKVISIATGNKAISSRVNGDTRIIWNYNNSAINVLDLIDLGGHSGSNRVYN